MTEKEKIISLLSEIRSNYNCFDDSEEPYYRALSEAIKALSGSKTGQWIYNPEEYPLGNPDGHYECDQCGEMVSEKKNYCPFCGSYNGGGAW